jgi:hypothetical protein
MRRPDGFALAALAVAVAVFFAPALFGDRAVFTWNMDRWHPWAATASPDDLARPTRLADCARQFYVMRFLLDRAVDEGRIPLWNRWIDSGTPFLANFQPGVFYPPNLLLAVSGLDVLRQTDLFVAAHVLLAAAGMFLLLRALGVTVLAALLGAVTLACGGFNAARTGLPTMIATGAWLPWALLASWRWFEREDAVGFAGMALCLGLSGLAGFAQIFVFVAYGWGLFGLVEGLARRPRPSPRAWLGWLAAGTLGFLLVAVHVVPTVEFMRACTDAANPPGMLASGTLHPWAVAKFLVPDLLGHPADGSNASYLLSMGDGHYTQTEHSTAVYAGILPLLLAAAVLLAPGDRRRDTFAGLVLLGVGAVLCLHTPLTEHLGLVPGLGFSRPDRATFLSGFGIALLGALGADQLAGREGPGLRRHANVFALVCAAAALAFALVVVAGGARLLPYAVGRALGDAAVRRAGLAAAAFVAASGALVGARAAGRLSGRAFLALALALVTVDVGLFASRFNVMQPRTSVYRPPAPGGALEFLLAKQASDGPFRIFRYEPARSQFQGVLPPSTASVYGLEDILGFDSLNLDRCAELLAAIDPAIVVRRGNLRGTGRTDVLASPLLDLLDVRYVLAPPEAAGSVPPGLVLAHASDLAVFENPDHLPRAFLLPEVRVLADRERVLEAMKEPSFRPDLWAYSEVSIPGLPSGAAARTGGEAGRARLVEHEDERVRVEVVASRTALLVLGDAYFPGWRALVDGVERPIHRVDYFLRGVVVGPEDREVVFEYRPASFRVGAAVSVLALATVAAAALGLARRRRAQGAPA